MNRGKKLWRAAPNLGVIFLLSCFLTSCITINRIQSPQSMASNIDPVCGMKVDTATALKTDYAGRTYYFDTDECQKVFLKNPEKFAVGQYSHHANDGMGHMGWAGGTVMITAMVIAMTSMILFGHVWR